MKKTLNIVIPFYNEKDCAEELLNRLFKLKNELADEIDTGFIFVNDGSDDESPDIIEKYAAKYDFVRMINFSRNFGHEIAVTAGLDYSTADFTAIIDADLQDPPEIIKDMYLKIKQGYDIVYGKRFKRKSETVFKKVTAFVFYRLLNFICDIKLPTDTGNFRLITADVRKAVTSCREHKRFMRGITASIGFKSIPLYYTREGRFAGKTHYSIKSMVKLALTAIFELSSAPLAFVRMLGVILFVCAAAAALAGKTIIATIMLIGCIQVFSTYIIGCYVERIYVESKNRPLYIVSKTINIPAA